MPCIAERGHRGDGAFGGQAALDQMHRGRRLCNPVGAVAAGILGADGDDHAQLCRYDVQALGTILAIPCICPQPHRHCRLSGPTIRSIRGRSSGRAERSIPAGPRGRSRQGRAWRQDTSNGSEMPARSVPAFTLPQPAAGPPMPGAGASRARQTGLRTAPGSASSGRPDRRPVESALLQPLAGHHQPGPVPDRTSSLSPSLARNTNTVPVNGSSFRTDWTSAASPPCPFRKPHRLRRDQDAHLVRGHHHEGAANACTISAMRTAQPVRTRPRLRRSRRLAKRVPRPSPCAATPTTGSA